MTNHKALVFEVHVVGFVYVEGTLVGIYYKWNENFKTDVPGGYISNAIYPVDLTSRSGHKKVFCLLL